MVKKLLIPLVFILMAGSATMGQSSGTLKGKVTDKVTKETIPFASIVLENKGTQVGGTTSDIDGNYVIKPIPPGTYDLKATFVGYKNVIVQNISIRSDKTEFYDFSLEPTTTQLQTVEVIQYKVPLISKDNTVSGATVTKEEISKMPVRTGAGVATSVGGVFSRDGEIGSMRGQRTGGNDIYIDGIRVRGNSSLPESAIEQVSVMLGGVPAQYGDATGGIINITTKGPSREYSGGIELQTSQFLDAFGQHRVGLNLTGPLFVNKKTKEALVGFFLAGDFNYHKDGATLAIDQYVVKDSKLDSLKRFPLIFRDGGLNQSANYLRMSDLEKIKYSPNTQGYDISTTGKFDIRAGKNSNFVLGGSYNKTSGKNYNFYYSLMDYDRNSLSSGNTWRVFGRYTVRFPSDKDSKNLLKNIYLSIQADYTSIFNKTEDADLKDNLFAYGKVGRFNSYKMKSYERQIDTTNKLIAVAQTGWADTLITFDRDEYNPVLANYTSNIYDLFGNFLAYREQVYSLGGLLNGTTANDRFNGVYGLFSTPGNAQAGYSISSSNQFSSTLNFSTDIKNHEIKFGLTFEKVRSNGYSYAPASFWDQMYLKTNAHIIQIDKSTPASITDLGTLDTLGATYTVQRWDYNRIIDKEGQFYFDKKLRDAMGIAIDGQDFIDIDSYDINTNTISYYSSDMVRHVVTLKQPISVDFFSPDELLNDGNSIGFARGYDFYGNKIKSNDKPSYMDFFNETAPGPDGKPYKTRRIAPYEPIYMAGYVQDKFAFDDLVFNVGVRVDRFDANQPTLQDPYSLFPIKTVAEVTNFTHPASMGPGYVVYVDNSDNPNFVKGYRNGSVWYDADGAEVTTNPEKSSITTENGLAPYFKQSISDRTITKESFADYKPQITVMPRISFSFPITDEALFYAHYDVITQRPKTSNVYNPVDILTWAVTNTPTMTNPNLRPERNVNYELGYQQKLNSTSSLNISAFYIESRDMIQSFRFSGAYPKTYYSYNNIDFGTVKGVTLSYDLRRTGNARIRANYTLQFANGTGTDSETSKGLIQSDQPNLRTLIPLGYDQRHTIQINFDFRYGEGKEYNGPEWNGHKILENFGFNISANGASGTPYTRSNKIHPFFSGSDNTFGSINGSRLPWSFRMDGRLDKDFALNGGTDKKGKKKEYALNVYLQVLNILNSKNIMGVYASTGNPDDDGYLAASEWQTQIYSQLDPQSFIDLYRLRINNPFNYSNPRMIRLGVGLNF